MSTYKNLVKRKQGDVQRYTGCGTELLATGVMTRAGFDVADPVVPGGNDNVVYHKSSGRNFCRTQTKTVISGRCPIKRQGRGGVAIERGKYHLAATPYTGIDVFIYVDFLDEEGYENYFDVYFVPFEVASEISQGKKRDYLHIDDIEDYKFNFNPLFEALNSREELDVGEELSKEEVVEAMAEAMTNITEE